ncbi:hypothetical protein ACFWA0_26255, partial [Streptomyces xanthophaeus]
METITERECNEWAIARSRVDEVLAPGYDAVVGPAPSEGLPAPGVQPARPEPAEAAKPKQWYRCRARGWPGRRLLLLRLPGAEQVEQPCVAVHAQGLGLDA